MAIQQVHLSSSFYKEQSVVLGVSLQALENYNTTTSVLALSLPPFYNFLLYLTLSL